MLYLTPRVNKEISPSLVREKVFIPSYISVQKCANYDIRVHRKFNLMELIFNLGKTANPFGIRVIFLVHDENCGLRLLSCPEV